jgi:HEAT repeat protein
VHASFEAVLRLPEEALRDLLAAGEPAERVWAAWALALRLDCASTIPLMQGAARDPDEGIRRHMVVLLTGLGEYEAVAAMAADPPPLVRATACQYLVRFAAVRPDSWPLLLERLRDPEAVVRETILLHLPREAPPGS